MTMKQTGLALDTTINPIENLKEVLVSSLSLFPYQRVSIFTYSPLTQVGQGLLFATRKGIASLGDIKEDIRSIPLVKKAIQQNRSQFIVVAKSPHLFPLKYIEQFSITSLLIIPISHAGTVVGCVFADRFNHSVAVNQHVIKQIEEYFNETTRFIYAADLQDKRVKLSKREQEIVRLLSNGLSTKEIAAQKKISEYTIQDYVRSSMKKLGAKNRTEAVAISIRKNIIS